MQEFPEHDLRYVAQRIPRDVRELLANNHGRLFLGGGFIRATIAGETPSDIDLFGASQSELEAIAKLFAAKREGSRIHKTKNAITVITPNRLLVQFITRWTFDNGQACAESFDFTICQAVIWRDGNQSNSAWRSAISNRFYQDLAARRLVYTAPQREEEAGGSLLRVLKYAKRGYSIQVGSLGGVLARVFASVRNSHLTQTEADTGRVLTGLLREVDPLLVVDGFDVVDEHEPEQADDGLCI